MTKQEADRLSCVIAFRTTKGDRELFEEEAKAQGRSLGDFIFQLINAGWKELQAEKKEQRKKAGG
jgi:uncharacterized protein (DUF1778 family)